MSISFRFARPDELEDVAHLTSHSFTGAGRTPDWWIERFQATAYGDGPEIIWVGEEGGKVVATCQLHSLVHWISGAEVPSMGLGTVAISPTHRQRGIAGRLVESAILAARERGDLISSLYPFRVAFYGRSGYGLAGEAHQYHVPPAALPASDERNRVEVVSGDPSLAEVRALYERWARTQTGQVKRTEQGWREMLGGGDKLLVGYHGENEELTGYALARYPGQVAPEERYLSVEEHVWLTTDARRGLYGWLASMGDQWRGVALRSLPEHRLEDWLREPRLSGAKLPPWGIWFPSAALLRGPMFRVLDLPGAWRVRRVDAEEAIALSLEVEDEQVPENAGRWRLRLEAGRVEVERGDGPADLSLRLGIQALSRIYMGALPAAAAVAAGLVQADRPERLGELDRALRLPQAWTFDRY